MRFPKIDDVAARLREINKTTLSDDDADEGIDVRLQVYPDGKWIVHYGSADYDQDHRGYWGSSSVPGDGRRFDSKALARDLIDQAKEHRAQGGDDEVDEPQQAREAASGREMNMPRGTFKDAQHLHEILEKGVLLNEDRVEVEGVIDLDDDTPVAIGIVVDVNGYGPHTGAMYVEQGGHIDDALQGAHEILEEWMREHYEDVDEHLAETFDGWAFKISPHEFMRALEGTTADALITEDDVVGSEDEPEDDEDEDYEEDEE